MDMEVAGVPDDSNNMTEGNVDPFESLQRVWGIVTRQRWWVLGASSCIPVVVILFTLSLPNQYVSKATLLLKQQQVSQRFVQPDSMTTVSGAVQALKLEVLSRTRLLQIIDELGLYPREKKEVSAEMLVEKMRKDIDIEPLESASERELTAFTVAFTAPNPRLAQEVTARVASLFIENNLKTRGDQAANTTKFLSDRLEAAKQQMTEQEQRLESFKASNLGELPEQQQTNLVALSEARERLDGVASNLLQLQQQQASVAASLSDRLTHLQTEKNALLTHFTTHHPDVMKKDREIEKMKAIVDRVRTGTADGLSSGGEPFDDPATEGILRQAATNIVQIAILTKQQDRLKLDVAQYQRRLNLAPLREQQLAEILRDYNLYKQDYTDLVNKKLQSQLAGGVEESQQGQQFRMVDPPTLPEKPIGPKRLKISLGAVAGGLFLGLALAFAFDMRNTSFHTESVLRQSFSIPLIMSIPLVRTPAESRSRNFRIFGEWIAGCTLAAALFVAEFYVFRHG